MDVETDPKSDAQVYYLSSLQYDIPAKPKPGEKAKPQTSDQVHNYFFFLPHNFILSFIQHPLL